VASLVTSVPALARSPGWSQIKEELEVQVPLEDHQVALRLTARPTATGRFYYLVCPCCDRRCRDILVKCCKEATRPSSGPRVGSEAQIGCRICLRIRHADQMVPRSMWGREVVRPTRQIRRIEQKLARPGPDRNTQRRLRRRRRLLLQRVEQELRRRQVEMQGAAEVLGL